MKDGDVFASKYDSKHLKIRVPNIVMVFSNSPPNVRGLTKVRFRVFNINNNQLQKENLVEIKDPRRKDVFICHHPPLIFTPTQQKYLRR